MPQTEQSNPKRVWATRVEKTTVPVIDQIAYDLGYRRLTGGLENPRLVGNTGRMLDAIASGELVVLANGPSGLK